jgi:hypothetical protein
MGVSLASRLAQLEEWFDEARREYASACVRLDEAASDYYELRSRLKAEAKRVKA